MTIPWTRMFLPGDVMKAVVASAGFKERFGTLASHPYNESVPEQTVWWLFPKGQTQWGHWPAYSLGKFFFDRLSKRHVMRAGIHIEKGVALDHAKAYGGKAQHFGMTPSWAWYEFIEDLRSGKFACAAEEMARRAGVAVEIELEPNYPVDKPTISQLTAHHRFAIHEGGRLTLIEEKVQPKRLPGVGKVKSLRELAEVFVRATEQEPWTWVNALVYCAIPFYDPPPVGAGPAWTGKDFWHNVLEPLAGWVK